MEEKISTLVKEIATKSFGFNDKGDNVNAIFRPLSKDSRNWFAFIREDQGNSSAYSGLSFVCFPLKESKWIIALGVGTDNLGLDQELAERPYIKRAFRKLSAECAGCAGIVHSKDSFTDLNSILKYLGEDCDNDETVMKYDKVILAYRVVTINEVDLLDGDVEKFDKLFNKDSRSDDQVINGFLILLGWLAQYAEIRNWHFGNTNFNKRRSWAIDLITDKVTLNDQKDLDSIKELFEIKHTLILEGAPGCGKTRLASLISKDDELNFKKVLFTQFHAETTYSDFIGGIRPILNKELTFTNVKGVFLNAIEEALECRSENRKVLLIIDEINRANLSNVLGEVFYLFENESGERPKISLPSINKELRSLPDNLYIIGTMNTADRSIAVVDFALRRRFLWYTVKPRSLDGEVEVYSFNHHYYNEFAHLFEKYASSEELNLQPGQSYFIVPYQADYNEINCPVMKRRLEYELMPLMKEYFAEGYLEGAKEDFASFYFQKTRKYMYE